MLLTCPSCRAQSKIADERVPATGAWARCPKCSERFFIKPEGQGAALGDLGGQPEKKSGAAKPKRTPEAQALLDRLKKKNNETTATTSREAPSDVDLNTLPVVFPEARYSHWGYFIWFFVAVGCLIFGGLVLGGFNSIVTPRDHDDQDGPIVVGKNVSVYGDDQIRMDIFNILRIMNNSRYTDYEVTSSGPESRLFNYYRDYLIPSLCREGIYKIKMEIAPQGSGFVATGYCTDEEETKIEMRFKITPNDMVISYKDHNTTFVITPKSIEKPADIAVSDRDKNWEAMQEYKPEEKQPEPENQQLPYTTATDEKDQPEAPEEPAQDLPLKSKEFDYSALDEQPAEGGQNK